MTEKYQKVLLLWLILESVFRLFPKFRKLLAMLVKQFEILNGKLRGQIHKISPIKKQN